MFKKVFEFGVILGIISMFVIVCSYIMIYHGINTYGINLKTIGTIGIFGVVIAVPILLISAFYHFSLMGVESQKMKMTEKVLFWKVLGNGSLILGIILTSLGFTPEIKDFMEIVIQPGIMIMVGLIIFSFGLSFLHFWNPVISEEDLYEGEEIEIILLFKTVVKKDVTIYYYEIINDEGKILLFKCEDSDLEPGKKYQKETQIFPSDELI